MALPAFLLAFQLFNTIAGYVGQRSLAIQQQRGINDAFADSVEQSAEQREQINANAAEKQSDRARQALIERARLKAAAGESGLMGASTDRVVNEADQAGHRDAARIESGRRGALRAAELELQGLTSRAQSDMSRVRYPSLLGSGLQIATDVYGYKNMTGQLDKKR